MSLLLPFLCRRSSGWSTAAAAERTQTELRELPQRLHAPLLLPLRLGGGRRLSLVATPAGRRASAPPLAFRRGAARRRCRRRRRRLRFPFLLALAEACRKHRLQDVIRDTVGGVRGASRHLRLLGCRIVVVVVVGAVDPVVVVAAVVVVPVGHREVRRVVAVVTFFFARKS